MLKVVTRIIQLTPPMTHRVTIERQALTKELKVPRLKLLSRTTGQPDAWVTWTKVLIHHYTTCRLAPSACPVVKCRAVRTEILDPSTLEALCKRWKAQWTW